MANGLKNENYNIDAKMNINDFNIHRSKLLELLDNRHYYRLLNDNTCLISLLPKEIFEYILTMVEPNIETILDLDYYSKNMIHQFTTKYKYVYYYLSYTSCDWVFVMH